MLQFPANYIAGLASMQDLVPVRPTVVAPNCFGTTSGAVAAASPAAAVSLWHKVAASYHFSELLGGGRESHH
jgi:hypothetical protein